MISVSKPIRVFEHQLLQIDENVGFLRRHWQSLGWYNEKHGGGFFSLTPNGVKFNQNVGVIQVDNITIEILPKIGRIAEKGQEDKWQKVLIDMLRECRWMQVFAQEKAALRFKPNSILEAYIELFVRECEDLVRQGLIKKYRSVDSNCAALKGKLLFSKQIQYNIVHQEKFYTRHQVFDRENIFNQILIKALKIIPVISHSSFLKDRVYSLILAFPELEDIQVNINTIEKLVFNRQSSRYKEAIEIAAMLLLNYRPDISTGRNHVLAILFDMNDLWEEYVYLQLYKHKPKNWNIRLQNSKRFWQLNNSNSVKTIRPDIVITNTENQKSVILDTKWKLPDNNIPADSDLKQMFVYNEYWNGLTAILLYPNPTFIEVPLYAQGEFKQDNTVRHGCSVMKTTVLNKENNSLDKLVGQRINQFLTQAILK